MATRLAVDDELIVGCGLGRVLSPREPLRASARKVSVYNSASTAPSSMVSITDALPGLTGPRDRRRARPRTAERPPRAPARKGRTTARQPWPPSRRGVPQAGRRAVRSMEGAPRAGLQAAQVWRRLRREAAAESLARGALRRETSTVGTARCAVTHQGSDASLACFHRV